LEVEETEAEAMGSGLVSGGCFKDVKEGFQRDTIG
jgi:hypothetical protein